MVGQLTRRTTTTALATIAATVLLASIVGCTGADDRAGGGANDSESDTPVRGGELVYGLEAETSSGWCLTDSTLAISGIMVTRAIYDTLTTPSASDGFVPYLAESVEPDDDFTRWTITLREGVTFHDGSPLDAEVVKNNLDAYRGVYPGRASLFFSFVLEPIDSVQVVDPLTLEVTTTLPWPAFPAYLSGGGRLGIMAQAQLDDPDSCDTDLIGTGPFMLEEWEVGDHLSATRNPDYWATDADGQQLPYLDRIEFRPIADAETRVNALTSGGIDIMHTEQANAVETLEAEAGSGTVELYQSLENAEVGFLMLNAATPPFDSPIARRAVALAIDREAYRRVRSLDLFPLASGPFAPGTPGYLEDAGFPEHDLGEAQRLARQYEQENGRPIEFSYVFVGDNGGTLTAQFLQEQLARAGITAELRAVEQATLINTALGDDWNAIPYRNFPSGVPDGNYVWWYGGSPINFNKFDDAEINSLMDAARVETDPDAADAIYQDVNRRFAEQVYDVWLNWTEWTIASAPGVGGVTGPTLPGGFEPSPALAVGHSVAGLWTSR